MIPPVPAPAAPAPPWCPWRRRTPGRRSRGRARRRRTPCSRTSRWPCARRRCRPRAAGPGAPPASNPRPTRPGPPPAPLRRSGGDGRPAAAHAPDSRFPHDARHPAAADPGRIPAQRRQPGARLVPFAMVPSSPIELEEKRNKNQFISHLMMSIVRLTFFLRA